MNRTIRTGLALAALLSLAACTAVPGASIKPSPSASPTPTPSGGPASLVFRASHANGFVMPTWRFVKIPLIAVYSDGRVFSQGAQIEIYPGPLMPNVQVVQMTPAGLAEVLDAVEAAGLTEKDATYPARRIADAPDTVFTVVKDGRTVVTSFGALAFDEDPSAPAPEAKARKAATELLNKLGDLETMLGDDAGASVTYEPDEYQILAYPGDPNEGMDDEITRDPVAWPLTTPLASFGKLMPASEALPDGARCGSAGSTGAQGKVLAKALTEATTLTGFTSDDVVWTVLARPLLPGEQVCVDPDALNQ